MTTIPKPPQNEAGSTSRPIGEKLEGSVERVTFHNTENGYCVARLKVKGQKELVTLVGHSPSISAGEFVEAIGTWDRHRDFGIQFKADFIKTVQPSTLEGIEKYLASGMLKGIGPHFAEKLVATFGADIFNVIENSPQALRKVEGLGKVRIKKITSAWKDQKVVREIMVFLQGHGVSTSRAVRIYKTYGQNAIAKVQENPYQLARDVIGIGFKSADFIANQLGVPRNSMLRARAGINHVLLECSSNGHCAFPENELMQEAIKLLEIEEEVLAQAIQLEIQNKNLVRSTIDGQSCFYTAALYRSEGEVAQLLQELKTGKPIWNTADLEAEILQAQGKFKIKLAPLQNDAIKTALFNKVSVITGGPGTGKTTLTKVLVSVLQSKNIRIALCSPTGRAAKRLSECTGMDAKTIHRLLGMDQKKGGFAHTKDNLLPVDMLLVDEASMVDLTLMQALLKAIPHHASLVIIGDVDQIPSVGPGCVLNAIIESGAIATVKLTEIFRQAAQSQIIANAHRINRGEMPDLERRTEDSDFYFVAAEEPEKAISVLLELVKTRIPNKFHFHPVRDIQVLCPMNRGGLGARALNVELQKVLNPKAGVHIERFGSTYAPGDKVMVTVNDYDKEVFNGDIGFIKSIDLAEEEAVIDFDDRSIVFEFSDFDILTLAYATTIHKAQGSEYPAIILPISTQHFMMLKRNLIYTGVTRGKKLVVLVGQKRAIEIALNSRNQGKRWNDLARRIAVLS